MEEKFIKLKENILNEVTNYLEKNYDIDWEEITYEDNEELLNNLKEFQSQSFINYLDKTNLELMFNVFINRDNELEVEILDI